MQGIRVYLGCFLGDACSWVADMGNGGQGEVRTKGGFRARAASALVSMRGVIVLAHLVSCSALWLAILYSSSAESMEV